MDALFGGARLIEVSAGDFEYSFAVHGFPQAAELLIESCQPLLTPVSTPMLPPTPTPVPTLPPTPTTTPQAGSLGPIVPLDAQTAADPQLFMNEMTADEQTCVEENGETLGEKPLEQYLHDLWQCVGDETLLRYHTHFYGIRSLQHDDLDLHPRGNRIDRPARDDDDWHTAIGGYYGVRGGGAGVYDRGGGQAVLGNSNALGRRSLQPRDGRPALRTREEGGVSRFLGVLRKHVGNDDDLIDAYNHEIGICQQS